MKQKDGCWGIIGLIIYIVFAVGLMIEGVDPISAILWPFLVMLVIVILMIAV